MSRPTLEFRQFVLKISSRCDLACDHCYVYQAADQSWRGRPMAMSDETISWTAQRIAEHAKMHLLPGVSVVLHGGEPLLAGPKRLKLIAETLRAALDGVCDLDLRIHTNGILLDENFCRLFAEYGVKVGVSIDGYRAANDRHRRYADGRSSYDQVVTAIGRLRSERYRHLYAGLLCTIDLANDPVSVYLSMLDLQPPRIDFLLPHATWETPPFRPPGSEAAYADWLIAIFDRWWADGKPMRVRTFDSIIRTAHGGDSLTEALGTGPSDLVVIETDGTYEQADSLKAAFDGAPATGLSVFADSLDTVARHHGIVARSRGVGGLCDTCRSCPVVGSCGGGLYAHRYRAANGFTNPSVYCPDLLKLIRHVSHKTVRDGKRGSSCPTHAIPAAEFRELAGGRGGTAAVQRLAEAQPSLGRALLAAVYQQAMLDGGAAAAADVPSAWELLTRIDRTHPAVISDVLSHPYFRAWAMRRLGQRPGTVSESVHGTTSPAADLGYLATMAVAAAIRSGTSARIGLPVLGGAVYLPTLGRYDLGGPALGQAPGRPADLVLVTVVEASDAVTIQAPDGERRLARADLLPSASAHGASADGAGACWQPTRRLTAPGISVTLEDADPYRACYDWEVSPRLSDAEFGAWQSRFQEAWTEIRQQDDAYAPGLAAGLRSIVPLSAAAPGREVSATARDAFGAIAAALPAEPSTLALLLIHEFQHVKLGAVLDIYDLYDVADTRLFRAPWREDLRPLEGLLQGTYAHIAVTDYWRSRRGAVDSAHDAGAAAHARDRFAHWRTQTASAIETLAESGSLTPLGRQLVDGMRDSVAPWLAEPVTAPEPGSLRVTGVSNRAAAGLRWAGFPGALDRADLANDLRSLGVKAGQVLLVHSSMLRLGPVRDGAAAVVAALRHAIGTAGTLVVPTGTSANSDTSRLDAARTAGMTAEQIRRYRELMPPFDPATTPSDEMGRIAEVVRTTSGAIRSSHPQSSFAAIGPMADRLMDGHAPTCHLGESSPLARLYETDAWILLLGVGYDACSAFHLAEYRYVPDPPRRAYRCVVTIDNQVTWWEYEDIVLDDSDHLRIGADFDRTGHVIKGHVGHAECRLIPLVPAVDFATNWLSCHRAR
jgi:uncharacterized protein